MNIDWSQYPSQPEPPQIPAWRDTPEREACFEEMHQQSPKEGLIYLWSYLAAFILVALWVGKDLLFPLSASEFFIDFLMTMLLAIFPGVFFLFIGIVIHGIWKHCLLYKKYGFIVWKLKRPDISPALEKILDGRPEFDEKLFRQYWPSDERVGVAFELLKMARRYWYSTGKMLYPNDPLILFFFGRNIMIGSNRVLPPDDYFLEDCDDEFRFDSELVTNDSPFAEMVELCLAGKKKPEGKDS